MTITIQVRPGIKFHDGTDLTAEDVAYSLNRHRDPKVGSYLATFHERVSDVTATGPLEVTVKFSQPDADLPLRARDDGRCGCLEGLHGAKRRQDRNAGGRHRRHRPVQVHVLDEGSADRPRPLRRLLEQGSPAQGQAVRRQDHPRRGDDRAGAARPARSTVSSAPRSPGRASRAPRASRTSRSTPRPPTRSTTWR